jgi:DNA-binding NarL/FixJ family response regulator
MLTSILIYEDNNNLRAGIKALLDLSGGFYVSGAFPDCNNIEHEVGVYQPELIIMDIDMPGVNGIEGIKIAKRTSRDVKILMFTVFDDDEKIFAALTNGADGYLLKKAAPEKLIEALHDLKRGESPMTPSIARKVLNYFATQKTIRKEYDLTDKEKEVLKHLTRGLSYKLIAAEIAISIETVRTHLKHIYTKLHVNSSTQAVSKAINEKLI